MNTYARLAVALVAIAIAVGGAAYFLAPAGKVGGPPNAVPSLVPSPSARASSTPAATAVPSPTILAEQGFVYPGTYVPSFQPSLMFKINSEIQHNCAPNFKCRGSIDANLPGWLYLEFGLPRIEVGIVRVDKLNDPAQAGRLIDPPADLAAWIASRPGLTVIAQKTVTVGGLAGTQLDARIGNKDVTFGPIPGVTDPPNGLGANFVVRLFVVPVHGHQILISLHAEDGSLEELQPLVDSIVWN